MNIITYLKDLIDEFLNSNNLKWKVVVGIDKNISGFKNLNNFPLILIEEIKLDMSPNHINYLNGELNFNLTVFFYNAQENAYKDLEDNFIVKFNQFILNKNELTINNINFDTNNDNVYIVNYNLTNSSFSFN